MWLGEKTERQTVSKVEKDINAWVHMKNIVYFYQQRACAYIKSKVLRPIENSASFNFSTRFEIKL